MTIDRAKMLCSVLALGLLSSCTANDPGMGDAVRSNYAAQVVNPEPEYAEPMAANADQTAAAQERYRKGTVKKPVGVKTTTGGSGSGGGGGSSGSSGGN